MNSRRWVIGRVVMAGMAVWALPAGANNITVTNVALRGLNEGQNYINVKFDVRWENSWRISSGPSNWDAAWTFVKYRPEGSNEWRHARLATNATDHTVPAGASLAVGLTGTNGIGAFIYRASDGTGTVNNTNVLLRWDFSGTGIQKGVNVEVAVFAVEMVYIPEGAFYLGSGGTESGRLYEGPDPGSKQPFHVTNSGAITCSNAAGYLWGENADTTMGGNGVISNDFPNGYDAFYIMKAEMSQGQYADFLNKLTYIQATNRYSGSLYGIWRYSIHGSFTNSTADAPDRACLNLSWGDGAAYADWAGLRPMTELEFEKACRGTNAPVTNEYVWGTVNIRATAYTLSNNGLSNETVNSPSVTTGNALYASTVGGITGSVRCGIFAASMSDPTREEAGATFYGAMEMGGNLKEATVTIGNNAGRSFRGTHGDGSLDAAGDATNSDWAAGGSGNRGGFWSAGGFAELTTSSRFRATTIPSRDYPYGFRAVRSYP